MKKILIFALTMLFAFASGTYAQTSDFAKDVKVSIEKPDLKGDEILIKDLGVDVNGNQVYRCYNKDGYLDYMITEKGDVNGFVHLYDYTGVENIYAEFEVPDVKYYKTVYSLNSQSINDALKRHEHGKGILGFGAISNKEYKAFTSKYLNSGIFLSYTRNGKEHRMYCGVEYM